MIEREEGVRVVANRPDSSQENGRTGIVLSAGYFGFFAHAGFMLAIEELGLDYAAIAGSSAGAIVAALHASGVPASEIIDHLLSVRREDFWDSTGFGGILRALIRRGRGWTGLLRGDLFEEMIRDRLRAQTFEACPRSLYLTAFNLTTGQDETFHSGTIADKVRASCSYPFLMSPKKINGSDYWDGGFLAKIPVEALVEAERPERLLIHYLPTQKETKSFAERKWSAVGLLETALIAARSEIETHRLERLSAFKDIIIWVEPVVPRAGPNDLSAGRAAVEAAYHHALDTLSHLKV